MKHVKNSMNYKPCTNAPKKSMILGCNFWMICLELNWLFYKFNIATFWICMDVLWYESCLTMLFL